MINPNTNAPGISYEGSFVPPTIRVAPGDTISITYVSVDGTTLHLVAIDGIPMKAYSEQESDVANVVIPQAGRAEFTVRAPSGESTFRTTCVYTGPEGVANPTAALATIVSGTTTAVSGAPYQQALGAAAQRRGDTRNAGNGRILPIAKMSDAYFGNSFRRMRQACEFVGKEIERALSTGFSGRSLP
jgi:hypothetical protein